MDWRTVRMGVNVNHRSIECAEEEGSRFNVYGLMPQDLNETECRFVEMLDEDTTGTVAWWHRNESR